MATESTMMTDAEAIAAVIAGARCTTKHTLARGRSLGRPGGAAMTHDATQLYFDRCEKLDAMLAAGQLTLDQHLRATQAAKDELRATLTCRGMALGEADESVTRVSRPAPPAP